ncbi:hypothetical protein GCM10027359_31290 [Marilutibacter aestuarii]
MGLTPVEAKQLVQADAALRRGPTQVSGLVFALISVLSGSLPAGPEALEPAASHAWRTQAGLSLKERLLLLRIPGRGS